jgi:hypothetical protein
MAMTITPGWDFAYNDVPTRARLELMTAAMSITGIPLSQINTNLVGIKYGDTSVSLPAEGWIWGDTDGSLWVKTRFGKCKFFRGNWGGWETQRYLAADPLDHWTLPQPAPVPIGELRSVSAGASNESDVRYRIGTNTIGRFVVKNLDTATSGVAVRLLGRGAHTGEPIRTNRLGSPDYSVRHGSAQEDYEVSIFPATNADAPGQGRKKCLLLYQGIGQNRALAWFFGYEVMQD